MQFQEDNTTTSALEILIIQILITLFSLNYLRLLLPNISNDYRKHNLLKISDVLCDHFPSASSHPTSPASSSSAATSDHPPTTTATDSVASTVTRLGLGLAPQMASLCYTLLTKPILSFKLFHHLFCLSFHIPYQFPYHLYLTKCQHIHLRELTHLFLLSSLLLILLSQLLALPSTVITMAYPVIAFISLSAPYLLKAYSFSQLTLGLHLSSEDDLIDLLLADGIRAVEELFSSSETMTNFRSYIGEITLPHSPSDCLFPSLSL
jgi:hypothetical protein